MNNLGFLSNLLNRHNGVGETVRPRVRSRFEAEGPSGDVSGEVQDVNMMDSAISPVEPGDNGRQSLITNPAPAETVGKGNGRTYAGKQQGLPRPVPVVHGETPDPSLTGTSGRLGPDVTVSLEPSPVPPEHRTGGQADYRFMENTPGPLVPTGETGTEPGQSRGSLLMQPSRMEPSPTEPSRTEPSRLQSPGTPDHSQPEPVQTTGQLDIQPSLLPDPAPKVSKPVDGFVGISEAVHEPSPGGLLVDFPGDLSSNKEGPVQNGPVVNVTIGRIDVRATRPATPEQPRKKKKPSGVMSLDQYLNMCARGGNR